MSETLIDDRAASGSRRRRPDARGPTAPARPTSPTATVAPGAGLASPWHRFITMPIEGWITLIVVVVVRVFVFYSSGPRTSWPTTPRPAATWAPTCGRPAFLRDHLLPQGRLTGWTPDWYAGFPAFKFYMIIPSLAIALLSYVIPYGIAFKLIAISGVVTLPIAAWAFGRLSRMPFPARRCWRWAPPPSCSTGRSRSTAATSRRPWPASSPSRSR